MPRQINGWLGAFAQPGHWGRNESGNFWIQAWEGDYNSIQLLAENVASVLGLVYEVTESFGKFRIEVHYPWSNLPNAAQTDMVVKWELFSATSEKDLLEAQVEVPNLIGTLTQDQIRQIRHFVLDKPTTLQTDPNNSALTLPSLQPIVDADFLPPLVPAADLFGMTTNATNAAQAVIVYNLMMRGVTSHPVEQPILRRTMITSQHYAVALALVNVRKIISTASLISLENISSESLFYNPGNGQLLLPNDVSTYPNLAYGWYKGFPTVQEIALLKYSIVQEWKYGLWTTLVWNTPL
jgi:hypothetical protein